MESAIFFQVKEDFKVSIINNCMLNCTNTAIFYIFEYGAACSAESGAK